MIDFHCHLLQGIDDGSRSVETSINILEQSREQGVMKIVATPHFYASRMSIDRFLENRQAAYKALMAEASLHKHSDTECSGEALLQKHSDTECSAEAPALPEIILGAEVAFFDNMSRSERIGELAIVGTNILMVEMPFVDWEDAHLREIEKLCSRYTVIIAHIERFMNRRNKRRIKELIDMSRSLPIKLQVNAEAFEDRKLRRRLLKMFAAGEAHMLGSDCHGMHRRPPNITIGMDALREALGESFLCEMIMRNEELLGSDR